VFSPFVSSRKTFSMVYEYRVCGQPQQRRISDTLLLKRTEMGNCCGKNDGASSGAFQGTGHRLGSANEVPPLAPQSVGTKQKDGLPKPRHDPKLTNVDRDQQRVSRLAAAEARQKKQGGAPKKKKENKGAPLRGPNSQPLMQWTAG
jgi:hypothetical protein